MSRKYAIAVGSVLIAMMLLSGCPKAVKNPFLMMRPAVDDQYGYTQEYPIRIGYYKNLQENITLCKYYISSLRTLDGQVLEVVDRVSVEDLKYKPSGSYGGILDRYRLTTESGVDTLPLYFDIYHAEPLLIPKGLVFMQPSDSTSTIAGLLR